MSCGKAMMLLTIGKRIKERRLFLGMTVEDLAAKLEKNRATVYRYEKGDIENLPLDVLEPLAEALRTTPAYIMGWNSNTEYIKNAVETTIEEFTKMNFTPYENNRIREYMQTILPSKSNSMRHAREQRGISIEDFAEELGVSVEQVHKYENSEDFPLKHLKKINKLLNITYHDILGISRLYNPIYEQIYSLHLSEKELKELYEHALYLKNRR